VFSDSRRFYGVGDDRDLIVDVYTVEDDAWRPLPTEGLHCLVVVVAGEGRYRTYVAELRHLHRIVHRSAGDDPIDEVSVIVWKAFDVGSEGERVEVAGEEYRLVVGELVDEVGDEVSGILSRVGAIEREVCIYYDENFLRLLVTELTYCEELHLIVRVAAWDVGSARYVDDFPFYKLVTAFSVEDAIHHTLVEAIVGVAAEEGVGVADEGHKVVDLLLEQLLTPYDIGVYRFHKVRDTRVAFLPVVYLLEDVFAYIEEHVVGDDAQLLVFVDDHPIDLVELRPGKLPNGDVPLLYALELRQDRIFNNGLLLTYEECCREQYHRDDDYDIDHILHLFQ